MENADLPQLNSEPDDLEPLIDQDEDYIHGAPLLAWQGPSDLPEEENRKWFLFVMVASVVLILVSLVIHRPMLALIIAGVAWLSLMLRRLPSQDIDYIVTTTGFFIQDRFYPWSELEGFWIMKDHGHYVLGLDTEKKLFSSMMILLGEQNPLEIKEVLSLYIPFNEEYTKDFVSTWIENGINFIDDAMGVISTKFSQMKQARDQKNAITSKPAETSPVEEKPAEQEMEAELDLEAQPEKPEVKPEKQPAKKQPKKKSKKK